MPKHTYAVFLEEPFDKETFLGAFRTLKAAEKRVEESMLQRFANEDADYNLEVDERDKPCGEGVEKYIYAEADDNGRVSTLATYIIRQVYVEE